MLNEVCIEQLHVTENISRIKGLMSQQDLEKLLSLYVIYRSLENQTADDLEHCCPY